MGSVKSSRSKKASISLPAALEQELERVAKSEHRTLTDVLRDAARFYIDTRRFDVMQREVAAHAAKAGARTEDEVDELVHGVRRGRP